MYKKSVKKKFPPAQVNFYFHTRKINAYIYPDYEPKKKKKSATRLSENILNRNRVYLDTEEAKEKLKYVKR